MSDASSASSCGDYRIGASLRTIGVVEDRICTAHSSRTGDRCKRHAIIGGTVCPSHGGRAPQVRAAADKRILMMVNPALRRIRELIDTADSDHVKLSAAKDVLDRAGVIGTRNEKDASPQSVNNNTLIIQMIMQELADAPPDLRTRLGRRLLELSAD